MSDKSILIKKSVSWHNLPAETIYNAIEIIQFVNGKHKIHRFTKLCPSVWKYSTQYKIKIFEQYYFDHNKIDEINNLDWFCCGHKNYQDLYECQKCIALKDRLSSVHGKNKIKVFNLNIEIYNLRHTNNFSRTDVPSKCFDDKNLYYCGFAISLDESNNDISISVGNNTSIQFRHVQQILDRTSNKH